jgi:hypothetical protein
MPGDDLNLSHAQGPYIGDHGTQHIHFHGRPDVVWPVRSGVVPPLADCLQPRQVEQDALASSDAGTVVLTQVLSGLGGVGKTQLAAARAEQVWQQHGADLLVWITADSQESIVSGYAVAARDIGIDTGLTGPDAARRLLSWLARTDRRWLVVLDDLARPADLNGWWPPTVATGSTVVTTRLRDAALAGHGRRIMPVGLFTADQAIQYLAAKLDQHPYLADDLPGVVSDLGQLPLALAQASAYITNKNLPCSRYRKRFADRRRQLADLLPEAGFLPDDHRATVAATWSLSIEHANELQPAGLAKPILQLASILDPNTIPTQLLTTRAVINWLNRIREQTTTEDVIDGLYSLQRLNLATHDSDSPSPALFVHGLVQRAVRDQTSGELLDSAAVAAADAVVEMWPEVEDAALGQVLRANAEVLAMVRPDPLWTEAGGGHPVLFRIGRSLGEVGQVVAARDYFAQLHQVVVDRLGSDHPDALAARHNLAHWRGEAGDAAGAVEAFEAVLADRLRVLRPNHPDTLAARHGLAHWRGEAGDAAGAVEAFEAVLADRLRVLRPNHPDTLTTRHELARWRGEAGDAAGAVEAFEAVLAARLRVLGPDHPYTLAARHGLAYWRGEAGDAAGAVQAFEALLADVLRVEGPDYPYTLAARHNLAYWRGEAGDAAGAVQAFEALLADTLRVQGPDHPHTLTTRHNLARWRGEAGDAAGAVQAVEAVLADRLRVLGPDHPYTLTARHNLADWRGEAGDAAGAVQAFEAVLADRLRVQGPDHLDTLTTRHSLAYWRGEAGDAAGAVQAFEAVLADRLRVLGPDHLDTLAARHSLAYWRGEAGDAAGAVEGFEGLLADRVRVLGPDHPYTLTTRDNLAYWRGGPNPRS